MAKIVHILTPGFQSSNGRAFLMPLLRHQAALAQKYGIFIEFFNERTAHLNQCDVLLIDSKFYKPYWASPRRDEAITHFRDDYSQAGQSIFVDLNDSSGWVVPHVLPYVDFYMKSQLAKDRTLYAKPLYEHRPHSDYYHEKYGIRNNEDIWSQPITDPAYQQKMIVGWNSGLANYSLPGPWLMTGYEKTENSLFLTMPFYYAKPEKERTNKISYRFGASYPQKTLKYQRLKLMEVMSERFDLPTKKLNRFQYYFEMWESQIVLSPFGYGEITLKDFETFLAGAALIKPDMSFLETWPNFYQNDVTYTPFSWDLEDVIEKIETLLTDNARRIEIARNAQNLYRKYLTGPESERLFCEHFANILNRSKPL